MKRKLVSIAHLMERSGVSFGTSGARGLVTAMTDRTCYAYVRGFLEALALSPGPVALGGDLRPSTEQILTACAQAVIDAGHTPLHCGRVPSPALALLGLQRQIPSLMITGSHIPDDRNGIKFCTAQGEITKTHEEAIRATVVELDDSIFDDQGALLNPTPLPPPDDSALRVYMHRYIDFFGASALKGLRLGLYQHSSVGRDVLCEIFAALGAEVTPLGRAENFIPVDTEAIRPEDVQLAKQWAAQNAFDAIISADGDADRPLLADEAGVWLRGDVLGILAARALGIDALALPVSCNTAVEACGAFTAVHRTRIGSPFVISGMEELAAAGHVAVAGYEANGGFLLQTPLNLDGRDLEALPTRDVVLPVVAVLRTAVQQQKSVSQLLAQLPPRFTASDRLQQFPTELSQLRVRDFGEGSLEAISDRAQRWFGNFLPHALRSVDRTDGLRMVFDNGEIVHLRPSGNAPELRCYTEAATPARSQELKTLCLRVMEAWRNTHAAL